jgi:hypothetical protein
VLQAEADAARLELEMAHMASAAAGANFQEQSADMRAKLEAAERQLRCTCKRAVCLLTTN